VQDGAAKNVIWKSGGVGETKDCASTRQSATRLDASAVRRSVFLVILLLLVFATKKINKEK
jgi:hypothetical protein